MLQEKSVEPVTYEILRDFNCEQPGFLRGFNAVFRWGTFECSSNSASSYFNIGHIVRFDLVNELVIANLECSSGLFPEKHCDKCQAKEYEKNNSRSTHRFSEQLGNGIRCCWSFCRSRCRLCVHWVRFLFKSSRSSFARRAAEWHSLQFSRV